MSTNLTRRSDHSDSVVSSSKERSDSQRPETVKKRRGAARRRAHSALRCDLNTFVYAIQRKLIPISCVRPYFESSTARLDRVRGLGVLQSMYGLPAQMTNSCGRGYPEFFSAGWPPNRTDFSQISSIFSFVQGFLPR